MLVPGGACGGGERERERGERERREPTGYEPLERERGRLGVVPGTTRGSGVRGVLSPPATRSELSTPVSKMAISLENYIEFKCFSGEIAISETRVNSPRLVAGGMYQVHARAR